MEYEHFAEHANLTEEKKCQEIRIYFAKKEKRVLDVLEGYLTGNWRSLKRELRSLYTSSSEKRTYQPRDLQRFIARKRRISKLIHFDTYRREFQVITASLEARNALSGYDRDDYFWSGIQPASLRDTLEIELRTKNLWVDHTMPPSMNQVVETAIKFLNRDAYQPWTVSSRPKSTRGRSSRRDPPESDRESSDDTSDTSSSSSSSDEESSSDESESERKRKSTRKRTKNSVNDKSPSETKDDVTASIKPDQNTQSNIEDLAERFRRLELKLGERANRDSQTQNPRPVLHCIMCGLLGHGIRDCHESKFFITQGICRLDLNNRVVMSDGSALPRSEGEGGAARVIRERLANNMQSTSGPTLTRASTVELVSDEVYYNDESTELAALGSMEFEVVPADRTDKTKRSKPYDRTESKKVALPELPPRPRDPMPNRAYVELPPTILKRPTPEQPKENPMVIPTSSHVPDVVPDKPKTGRVLAPKKAPRFEVVDPKETVEKLRNQTPQYKYATELMNQTDQESVFQSLLSQPITLRLGEVLGSSFELSRRFQAATKSQRFAVPQAKASQVDVARESLSQAVEDVYVTELPDPAEFMVNSGEASPSDASMDEPCDMSYLRTLQQAYEHQFAYPIKEVNLARPHEYRAMVTARLNGKIGEYEYMMLVDSGSELNIMTLSQAQDLALPIDDSGSSWTLKGISGHTMGLEGICWNVPVKIGGIEFPHNFFITRSDLGNKDMVLGQPWLFSYSTRIDYIHGMGVTLQL